MRMAKGKKDDNQADLDKNRVYDIKIKNYENLSGVNHFE